MGIMGFLRERMGKILAFFIGLALFAFIIGEVMRSGSSFMREDRNLLGEVNGEKIPYDDFQKRVDQNSAQFKQAGQSNISPQILNYIQENAWNQMVAQVVLRKEIDKLGINIAPNESQSMVSGNNPHQQIIQAFSDPATHQFDRARLTNFLTQVPKLSEEMKKQWQSFLDQIFLEKLKEKYMSMATNGLYANSLEAKDEYENRNKTVNFKYVSIDYSSIPNDKVTISDEDYQKYYDEHKSTFKNTENLRTFDFISFNAAPSKDDSLAIKQQVEKLVNDFKASTNDSLFVQINAQTKVNLTYKHKGNLEPKIDSVMFNSSNGFVYGPYLSNGSYKIAKLVDAHFEPDSVKAKHILFDTKIIGVEKAIAKADSVKKLIQGGKSFADMANFYSIDPGSAKKGGDLGTFARGVMVPPFEDAAFSGKKGEFKIVTSQFGVHLIQIEDQKGSSKVAKVAIVDVPLKASSKTETIVYSNAQKFLGSLTKENFDEEVKKNGLQKKTASDVKGTASTVPGIESAREIVRWAFNAELNDFSDKVFISGSQYIVAHLVQIKPVGTLPLDMVKKQILPMVTNQVKAKQLTDKFNSSLNGAGNIDQVASKLGKTPVPIQNIVFANPVIPGSVPEFKLIGSIFGSRLNKLSKPIEGQQGVYVYTVDNFTNPVASTNLVREKQQITQNLAQRAEQGIFEALKDKASVKDYRAKIL